MPSQASDMRPEDFSAQLDHALQHWRAGQYDAAVEIANTVSKLSAREPFALFILALRAEQEKRWQDSAALLRLALEGRPAQFDFLMALVRVESQRHRYQACVDALALCLFMQPQREDIVHDLVELQSKLPIDVLSSAWLQADGRPRFELPIPNSMRRDPGIAYLIQHESQFGGYEFSTRAFLEAHLQGGDGLIDVGAHWGIFALSAATHPAGDIQVWALEPDPLNRAQLTAAAQRNQCASRIRVLPCAAGAQAGMSVLLRNSTMGHHLQPAQQGGPDLAAGGVSVPVLRLDDIFSDIELPERIFIKIDAEGFDVAALRGATRLLQDRRVVCVIWEKGLTYDHEPDASDLHQMLHTLEEMGFRHYRFASENGGGALQEFQADAHYCNIFSVKPALENQTSYPVNSYASTNAAPEETGRRLAMQEAKATDVTRWANPRQLEQDWEHRARHVAGWLPGGARVLDLGCGAMNLREHLADGSTYVGCDVVARNQYTIVCDFNQGQFPDQVALQASHLTVLGVLEYLYDVHAFLQHLCQANRPVILSYCTTEGIGDGGQRRALGWVNHFTPEQLHIVFGEAGLRVQREEKIDSVQRLYLLEPGGARCPEPKRVGILSYGNVGNFGDRLGTHVIHALLPAQAVVQPIYFNAMNRAEEEFDLLIVGMGTSLSQGLLTPELTALRKRAKRAIGIFGTQYRQSIDSNTLCAFIDSLDHWYARYQEDVLLYGQNCRRVTHLGDCLVSQFPLTLASRDERLDIGAEVWDDGALDRTIQRIQQYRRVYSTRLHPLLCALTSAHSVAYREQRDNGDAQVSGKFGSLLLDVFGRRFAEETWWDVDQAAVLRYKQHVQRELLRLQQYVADLLA
jgi:FkbM family methyltransferase